MGIRRLRDDMVVATNPAFARLFGRQLAMGDMVGDLGAIIEPRGRAVTLAKAARREPQRNIESQLRDSSGRIRDVLMSVHYLEIDGEDCSLGSWVDVTERTQPSETTRDREARFAAVFHQTSDVMLLLAVGADGVLRVDAANRRFVERISHVTKVDEADLIGLTLEQLTLDVYKLSREVLAQHQASIQRAIDTRAPGHVRGLDQLRFKATSRGGVADADLGRDRNSSLRLMALAHDRFPIVARQAVRTYKPGIRCTNPVFRRADGSGSVNAWRPQSAQRAAGCSDAANGGTARGPSSSSSSAASRRARVARQSRGHSSR